MELPQRKINRIPDYDYSQTGAYFVTICTQDRKKILSKISVGTGVLDCPQIQLLTYGEIADKYIRQLNDFYDHISVDQYAIMPDRIVACTYMAAAAVTGSSVIVEDVIPAHLVPVFSCFEQTGCRIDVSGNKIRIVSPERLCAPETIRTMPYPGFPTDCQALMMSVAAVADGVTLINENIFENRFKHASELNRMGADIRVYDKVAVVRGVDRLQGAGVSATDLRAGAALVVAGLCAEGVTTVDSIHYIDRGYDSLAENLTSLGASIRRND